MKRKNQRRQLFLSSKKFDYSWFAVPLPLSWQNTAGWIIFIVFTILIVTGTSNGANLTDGLDGLAAGISAIIGVGLMILSYTSSHIVFASYLNIMYVPGAEEVFIFSAAFTGACMFFYGTMVSLQRFLWVTQAVLCLEEL